LKKTLIVILGPTGIGKTELSIELALMLKTVIISSDSRQVYKELKIGTAAPKDEDLQRVQHFMIGNKSIHHYYSAGIYEEEVLEILKDIFKTKDTAILAGGSGMYIDAVCKGIDYLPDVDQSLRNKLLKQFEDEGIESLRFDLQRLDPEQYKVVDLNNPKRILKALEVCIQTGKTYTSFLTKPNKERAFKIIKIGLEREREDLYDRINQRVDIMFGEGLEEEARRYFEFRGLNSLNTVGYKELFEYFEGKYDFEEAKRLIKRNSRRYAKRQMTWFKRDSEINWFHPEEMDNIIDYIKRSV
jgi:tRNA dimethylallyltransferase